jgi:hypothetical protein
MVKSSVAVCALALVVAACSSPSPSDGTGFDNSSSGGGSGSGGSSGSSSGNTGSSSGDTGSSSGSTEVSSSSGGGSGSSSGSPSDAGLVFHDSGIAPIDAGGDSGSSVEWATLTLDSFTVAPGAEVYKCQMFANPFGGSADIVWMDGEMSKGSHHFFLFNLSPLEQAVYTSTLEDCPGGGKEFHPFPYLSQQPSWTETFPKDSNGLPMGYPLVAANKLMINVHYLNSGSLPINAQVSIKIQAYKPGVVKTHVGSLFLNQVNMSVPYSATPTLTAQTWPGNPGAASPDGSYTIMSSWSHMHQWATNFVATTNGQTLYSETNWDSPGLFWHVPNPIPNTPNPQTAHGVAGPVHMAANQSITWTCTYNYGPPQFTNVGSPLVFGDSAQNNVMCIYLAMFYPANPTAPDSINPL